MMWNENRWVALIASVLLLLAASGLSQPESIEENQDPELLQPSYFIPQPLYYYQPNENFIDNPSKKLSEFLGGPGKRTVMNSLHPNLIHYQDKRLSEFLGGPGKRLSEFLGGPGKRLSEFLGGPGKRLSEFLGGPGKRLYRKLNFLKYDEPSMKRLSEFLGGPGKRRPGFYNDPEGSEFLGGPGRR